MCIVDIEHLSCFRTFESAIFPSLCIIFTVDVLNCSLQGAPEITPGPVFISFTNRRGFCGTLCIYIYELYLYNPKLNRKMVDFNLLIILLPL